MRPFALLLQQAPHSPSKEATLTLWQEARAHWLHPETGEDGEDFLREQLGAMLRTLAHPSALLLHQLLQDGWQLTADLLDNPALSREEAALFFEEAATRWKEEALALDVGREGTIRRLLLLGQGRGLLNAHSPPIRTLASLLPGYPGNVEPGTHEDHASRSHLLNLVELLLDFPDLPRETLLHLADLSAVRQNALHLVRLVRHPGADLALWHRLLGQVRSPRLEMLKALAERREARLDPRIRQAMQEHASYPPLMAALCLEAGAETRERFLRLRGRSPARAAELLCHPDFHPHLHLEREDLLPLLSSADAETRLQALLGASRLGVEAPARPLSTALRS